MVREWSDRIGIEILVFEEMVYLPFEDEYRTRDLVEKGGRSFPCLAVIFVCGSEPGARFRIGQPFRR
jgi:hypothetical protein